MAGYSGIPQTLTQSELLCFLVIVCMIISMAKTKFMVIKHNKVSAEPDLLLDNCEIGTVQQYEYLGIVLDSKLAMNNYLDVI